MNREHLQARVLTVPAGVDHDALQEPATETASAGSPCHEQRADPGQVPRAAAVRCGAHRVEVVGTGEPVGRTDAAYVANGYSIYVGHPGTQGVVRVEELLDGDRQRVSEGIARLRLLFEQ
jgi:hypothetical protein